MRKNLEIFCSALLKSTIEYYGKYVFAIIERSSTALFTLKNSKNLSVNQISGWDETFDINPKNVSGTFLQKVEDFLHDFDE